MVRLPQIERRRALLARMAAVCAVLVLLIVGLSAFLRLSDAGATNRPLPLNQRLGLSVSDAGNSAKAVARLVHRVVASAVLLLVWVMLLAVWGVSPAMRTERWLIYGLLGLVLLLALLGRWSGHSNLPAVTLCNLLGGGAMFAVAVRLALAARAAPGRGVMRLQPWGWLASALLLLQIALGGLVGMNHTGLDDLARGLCGGFMDTWTLPMCGTNAVMAAAGVVLHGYVAVALVLVLFGWGRRAWCLGRRIWAWLPLALGLGQMALGSLLAVQGAPLGAALVHNLLGAGLLALLWGQVGANAVVARGEQ